MNTRIIWASILAIVASMATVGAVAADAPKMKMTTEIPESITTPDRVETRIGTLEFFDGIPTKKTAELVYDNLDFMRGVQAFLDGMPAASIYAMCNGLLEGAGVDDQTFGIFETLMDAKSIFLTPNSTTVYVTQCLDLENGPIVLEASPGLLGPMDDAYFRHVTDVGLTGPDKGEGGRYLFVPPGYEGELPAEGYFIVKSSTYTLWQLARAFVKDGNLEATAQGVKDTMRVYPWAQRDNPPETKFVNLSGLKINTIHANNELFYDELNHVIQKEPIGLVDHRRRRPTRPLER